MGMEDFWANFFVVVHKVQGAVVRGQDVTRKFRCMEKGNAIER